MKYIYRVPIVVALLSLAFFAFCKFYLRELNFEHPAILLLLGIAPNFFASLTIPMAVLNDYHKMKCDQLNKRDIVIKLLLPALLVFFVFEEYRPTFSGSKVSDIWDIVFSAIGLSLSYWIYLHLKKQKSADCKLAMEM